MFEPSGALLTMNNALHVSWAIVVGLLLGGFYYGGLWWTVRQLQSSRQPGLLFAIGFLVRTVAVVLGFFWVSRGDWTLIVVALVAFIGARMVLTRRWGPEVG